MMGKICKLVMVADIIALILSLWVLAEKLGAVNMGAMLISWLVIGITYAGAMWIYTVKVCEKVGNGK